MDTSRTLGAWLTLLLACLAGACGTDSNPAAPVSPSATPAVKVTSISVTGTTPFAAGQTIQFTATATLSNNTTQDCTATATWKSSNTTVATVSGGGLVTAIRTGEADVTATCQGVTGSRHVLVTGGLPQSNSLTISGASPMAPRQTVQFSAVANLRTLTTQESCTQSATWQSSNPSAATVSATGLVTAVASGETDITATCSSMAATMHVIVSPVVSVTVARADSVVIVFPAGQQVQLTATALYADGRAQDCAGGFTWQSSNTAMATVSQTGLVTGIAPPSQPWVNVSITATCSGVAGTIALSVQPSDSSTKSVTVSGPSALAPGQSAQLTATAVGNDGTTRDCTGSATWSTGMGGYVTVTSGGRVTAVREGPASVQATCNGVYGSLSINVTAGPTYVVSGTVRDEHGPLAKGYLQVTGGVNANVTVHCDSTGHYRIDGLVAGTLTLLAAAFGEFYNPASVTLQLTKDTTQDFTLQLSHFSVTGYVSERGTGAPVDGAKIEVVSGVNLGRSTTATVGAGGSSYFLGNLDPGAFTVRASKVGYDSTDQPVFISQHVASSPAINFSLNPIPGQCVDSVAPVQLLYFPRAGGTTTISVTAASSRSWTATSTADWIQVISGATGTGLGSVVAQVAPAVSDGSTRAGAVKIGCSATDPDARSAWISQRPNCQPGVAPAPDSPSVFPAAGGSGHLFVLAEPSCPWQAVSQTDWITLSGRPEGSSDADIYFSVAPNTTGAQRTGTIIVGESPVQVIQKG